MARHRIIAVLYQHFTESFLKLTIILCLGVSLTTIALAQDPTLKQPQSPTATQSLQCPAQTGIYFSDNGTWKEMEQVHSLGVHTTGVAKAAFSYGIASGKVKATFPDAVAPVQISDPASYFCSVNVAEQGRDIILIKLEQHGDKREIQLASIRTWTGVNAQYQDKAMVKLTVVKQQEKTFLFKAEGPIKEGEYIFFPKPLDTPQTSGIAKYNGPSAIGGYDFGFHLKK